jgi:hypothetical protein
MSVVCRRYSTRVLAVDCLGVERRNINSGSGPTFWWNVGQRRVGGGGN